MVRTVGEGSGPSEVEEEKDEGGGEGDGEVGGTSKVSPTGPRMGCAHLGGGGRRFEPVPQGKKRMIAFWGWLCCQDTSLYSSPHTPITSRPQPWRPRSLGSSCRNWGPAPSSAGG